MELITSSQNTMIKEIKSLREKKSRDEKGLYFIEGIRFLREALTEECEIVRTIISESFEKHKEAAELIGAVKEKGLMFHYVSDKLFKEISDTENPQGIMAVISMKDRKIDDLYKDSNFLIILDSVQDPGNMGTIIRTADASGVTGIVASKGCVDIYNPKVLRSTMGSVFRVPVYASENIADTIKELKARGVRVFASHLRGEEDLFNVDLSGKVAIIIGNEAKGIQEEMAENADVLLKIPMAGRAESLNASVAAGLLMYEVFRKNNKIQ